QLALNFLSLAKEGRGVDPLHALLDLYAERGDPGLARNVRSIVRIDSRAVIERLAIDGPMCFCRGTEVTLHVDQSVLAGQSTLLLSGLLSRLFARHAGINGFVRTRTRLLQKQEDVPWPMTPGNRSLIETSPARTGSKVCPRRSTSSNCCAVSNSVAVCSAIPAAPTVSRLG